MILLLKSFSKNTTSINKVRVKIYETYKKRDKLSSNHKTG